MNKIFTRGTLCTTALFLFLVCATVPVSTAEKNNKKSGDPIIFCAYPVYNFGEADNTDSITHDFVLENRGKSPLVISDVKTSCGCTVPKLEENTIQPGKSTILKVIFDLSKRKGPQEKPVYVMSNDPKVPNYTLNIEGTAKPVVDVEPYWVDFSGVSQKEKITRNIYISGMSDFNLEIASTSLKSDMFKVKKIDIQKGKKYNFEVTTNPGKLANSSMEQVREELHIYTNHPKMREISITLVAALTPELIVGPKEIILSNSIDGSKPSPTYIIVQSPAQKPFNINKVIPPSDEIFVSIDRMDTYTYRIKIENLIPYSKYIGQEFIILTNMKGFSKVKVPIRLSQDANGTPKSGGDPLTIEPGTANEQKK